MISIIIPAYNEEENIARCLTALTNQDTNEQFEIIIVNNASTDKTALVAKSFSDKINVRVIDESIKGRGAARYRGFSEAIGDIILSTDADCVVPGSWISSMVNTLRNSKAVALSGSFIVQDLSWYRSILFRKIQTLSALLYRIYFGHWWLNGFNFAVYKKVYADSGGFNPQLNVQEDIDLSFKISKLGHIQYTHKIKVLFSGRRFKSGVLRGLKPYLTSFIRFYWRKDEAVYLDDPR